MTYHITKAIKNEIPILISVPHCGTAFPDELKDQYKPELIQSLDDTDWFVDNLYDFAPALGITMITAHYSRWVIDLNRDPQSKPLYTDGRIITELCPTTTFLGEVLYGDRRKEVAQAEIERRVQQYYLPYHTRIEEELTRLKRKSGKVLLWDCHSIKQFVPTIRLEKFPDLILGDADGTSASKDLTQSSLDSLRASSFELSHNHPFKGGYITRHFGKPQENQHALQLEMTKVNYMDDEEKKYDTVRANKMRLLLENTFTKLSQQLN
ncbi:MAG: N-formylglutamate amidohydrolase [Cyclobacteriaceae bacterium]|jgi:N-formylglutamate deformylase